MNSPTSTPDEISKLAPNFFVLDGLTRERKSFVNMYDFPPASCRQLGEAAALSSGCCWSENETALFQISEHCQRRPKIPISHLTFFRTNLQLVCGFYETR